MYTACHSQHTSTPEFSSDISEGLGVGRGQRVGLMQTSRKEIRGDRKEMKKGAGDKEGEI